MLSNLSLRGGHRPTWQSRSTRTDHRKATGENVAGCERLPRPLRGLAMTRQGGAAVHQSPHAVKLPPTRRSLSAATDAIGLYGLSLPCTSRKCLPEIATGAKRPRNDTSGSAKVHQRPCTVELPRTGRSGSAAAIRPASWCGRWSGRKFVSRARGNNEDLQRQGNAVSAFP